MRIAYILCTWTLVVATMGTLAGQQIYQHAHPLWQPVKDEVYLQEVAWKLPTAHAIQSVAAHQGTCYVLMQDRIHRLQDDVLLPDEGAPAQATELVVIADKLWALTSEGLYQLSGSAWRQVSDRHIVSMTMHAGQLHLATREEIYRWEDGQLVSLKPAGGYYSSDITMVMEDGTQLHADPVRLGPIDRIASYSGTLYVLRPGQLVLFDGLTVDRDFIDWGTLPSSNTRDMLSQGSKLYITTDRGLCMLRGASLYTLGGEDGLPYKNTTCLEAGFAQDIWIGTTKGVIRKTREDWHYFAADHWLPGNHVHDVAVDDRMVYVATDAGLARISYEPYTLRKKAAYYERHLEEWGHKRMGFIHTIYKHDGEWIREISDNDGGHTSPFLVAMSFKYAVTGDPEAYDEALNAFMAMRWMEQITPIDGYVARSIFAPGHDKGGMGRHGSGGLPAKWHLSEDGKWYWKGDTSSDEIIAHFYAVSVFHDLAAKGKVKDMARDHLAKIARYIMDNGFQLIGMDGKPTRWGRWNPEYLLRPYGYWDKGVNGLEAQAFMRAAHAVTGDQAFEDGFQQLIEWGYNKYAIRQKNTFPPSNIAPWDDNLAYRSYYTLLRYTSDPKIKSDYLRSLERTWEIKRVEQIPWYNFAYGAITGNDCEVEQAVKHLREWQLDCIEHNYTNSYRDDLITPRGYRAYEFGSRAISPREISVQRNSRYAMRYDGGAGSRRVMEPNHFIRDYWMGRYHGFILPPEADDPALISVQPRTGQTFGAKPYDGPARPD